DQQDVHGLAAGRLEDHVVQVDVVDVEGDVLLGLPADRLRQLLGGHGRQRDLLDDDRVAREGGPEVGIPDVQGGNDTVDGVDDQGAVHDGAVDDRLGGEGLEARLYEAIAAPLRVLELDEFDRRGPDVQTDQVLGLTEQHAPPQPERINTVTGFDLWLFRLV